MPRLIIDNHEVQVDNGATILDAAKALGIEIPTMCFLQGYEPSTSCMICVVKVDGMQSLVPACGTIAKDGMRIQSNSEEIFQARKAALELLLSDHVGDCMGPCQTACPAHMNIPLMIRQIAAGKLRDAIATVKRDIALPAVLGRICPAPCERVCRRSIFDEAVSICLLKRYIADIDLQSPQTYLPACKPKKNKRVAIVGAGPAGLAAAYYLQQDGFDCTIFDQCESAGGGLRYGVPHEQLPRDVLDTEIAVIATLGVKFQFRTRIGSSISIRDLRRDFDAVFIAVGKIEKGDAESLGLQTDSNGIAIDAKTYQTNLPGVFAGGDAVRKRRLTVRAVADGKEVAVSIGQYLSSQKVTGPPRPFNTHIGKLKEGEIEAFMADVCRDSRVTPTETGCGFTAEQARTEAARCLHCDCRKAESCKLRQYAQQYGARTGRYKGERHTFVQHTSHPDVIYEPGKCIRCGLCIQIATRAGEELGLTFIGRGFDVRVAAPFHHSIAEGLKIAARKCAEACPTGALAFKKKT